jgi:hypothetical protein
MGLLCCSFGQNVSVKQGQEFIPENNSSFDYYVGSDATGVYMRRTRTKGKGTSYFFQKMDSKNLKSIFTKDFELQKNEQPMSCQLKNNKILLFTTLYDNKDKILLLREFSTNTGEQMGEVKKLASLASDPFGVNGRNFFVCFSPDNSKMMVVSEFQWPKKLQEVSAEIYEFPSYKKLSTKKIIDSYEQSTIASFNYQVDNEGRVFYLFNYMIDFEEEIGGKALGAIHPDQQKNSVLPLPFEKLEISNGTFEFVNDKLVFAGVFKDVVTKKERKAGKEKNVGVYSFFIEPKNLQVTSKGYDYFTDHVKEKLSYKDGMIGFKPSDKFYSFEEIFTFNNNVYLIESHSYVISSDKSYNSFERELIVSKFNSTGKLEWMKVIPKFTANSLNSFNYVVNNNKVFLFYCEHPKNLEKTTLTDYEPKSYRDIRNYNGSVLVCTTFDESGTLERKEMFRNEGWCYDPIPTNITLEPNNGLLFRMINQNKERYDVIKIN